MSIDHIKVSLPLEEYSALLEAGLADLRSVDEEGHFFIRTALQERGWLKTEALKETAEEKPDIPGEYDKLWLVLPTATWKKLFSQAIEAKVSVNQYLQMLIDENEEQIS